MVAPTRIGEGVKMKIDPAMRMAILQYIYDAGKPLATAKLLSLVPGLGAPWQSFKRIMSTLDTLTRMVNNGDLVTTEQLDHGGRKTDYYYLSAREFVRMTNAANRPTWQQACLLACCRAWRFLRRLCRRRW